MKYKAYSDAVETREFVYGSRLRKALMVWVGVCFAVLVLNVASQTDFWLWPIWVVATMWPLAVKAEQWIVGRGEFRAPDR